eukprot:1179020-Prorocentrum_minimum.AAC.5
MTGKQTSHEVLGVRIACTAVSFQNHSVWKLVKQPVRITQGQIRVTPSRVYEHVECLCTTNVQPRFLVDGPFKIKQLAPVITVAARSCEYDVVANVEPFQADYAGCLHSPPPAK